MISFKRGKFYILFWFDCLMVFLNLPWTMEKKTNMAIQESLKKLYPDGYWDCKPCGDTGTIHCNDPKECDSMKWIKN